MQMKGYLRGDNCIRHIRRRKGAGLLLVLQVVAFPLEVTWTFAQAPSSNPQAAQEREESCDPLWDGAIFGVLPGVLAGGLLVNISQWEPRSDQTVFLFSAALGALGGFLIDAAACNSPNGEESERRLFFGSSLAFESTTSEQAPLHELQADRARCLAIDLQEPVRGISRADAVPLALKYRFQLHQISPPDCLNRRTDLVTD